MVAPRAVSARAVGMPQVVADGEERLRLHNLSPLKGSRKKPTRKGRGYGAGQVRSVTGRSALGGRALRHKRRPPLPHSIHFCTALRRMDVDKRRARLPPLAKSRRTRLYTLKRARGLASPPNLVHRPSSSADPLTRPFVLVSSSLLPSYPLAGLTAIDPVLVGL